VDEAVVYSTCEAAARTVEADQQFMKQFLSNGPRNVGTGWDSSLADELRFLHLSLPNDGDFLLISQFQDCDPDEGARLKAKFGIEADACDELFEVLGRWHVMPTFEMKSAGLLTAAELRLACDVLHLGRTADRSRTSE
jgi:hypothetical protein